MKVGSKFNLGDFSLKDEPRSDRPSGFNDDDVIKALIESDRHVTSVRLKRSKIYGHIIT